MADKTVTINVVDRSVPPLRAINIAVINKPNPVTGYSATGQEVWDLIQISKYFITDEEGTPITGSNFYDYFPDMAPGGGGGAVDAYTKAQTDALLNEKVNKIEGYGLSEEDYTAQEKQKLASIQNPMMMKGRVDTVADLANVQDPQPGWVYLVGLTTATEFEEYTYTLDNNWEYIGTTTMSVDAVMSLESENPVQNKVITGTIDSLDNSFSALSSTTIDTIWNDTSTAFTCDTGYYFNTQVTCTVGGRQYTKKDTNPAIGMIIYTIGYSTPFFISTIESAVSYSVSGYPDAQAVYSVVYGGMTWYYSRIPYSMGGSLNDSEGHLLTYSGTVNFDSASDRVSPSSVLEILAYVHAAKA